MWNRSTNSPSPSILHRGSEIITTTRGYFTMNFLDEIGIDFCESQIVNNFVPEPEEKRDCQNCILDQSGYWFEQIVLFQKLTSSVLGHPTRYTIAQVKLFQKCIYCSFQCRCLRPLLPNDCFLCLHSHHSCWSHTAQ